METVEHYPQSISLRHYHIPNFLHQLPRPLLDPRKFDIKGMKMLDDEIQELVLCIYSGKHESMAQ